MDQKSICNGTVAITVNIYIHKHIILTYQTDNVIYWSFLVCIYAWLINEHEGEEIHIESANQIDSHLLLDVQFLAAGFVQHKLAGGSGPVALIPSRYHVR